ncbi:hypothetical protein ADUPG1_007859, partial [Aduncisulcus paluster]
MSRISKDVDISFINSDLSVIKPVLPLIRSDVLILPKEEDLHQITIEMTLQDPIKALPSRLFQLSPAHMIFLNTQAAQLGNSIKPNKATSMISSNSGTEIDFHKLFMALMGSMETKIFKRKAGNKIRVYSISLVLDLSPSTVCSTNLYHTIFTFIFALNLLSRLTIPHVDVIICSDRPYLVHKDAKPETILKPSSDLWLALGYAVSVATMYGGDSLAKGMLMALTLQSYRTCPSVLYSPVSQKSIWCFTDGNIGPLPRCLIHSCQHRAYIVDIDVIGIGLGIQGSICLEYAFQRCCYSVNPEELGEAIDCMYNPKTNKYKKPHFMIRCSEFQDIGDIKKIISCKPRNSYLADSVKRHCRSVNTWFGGDRLNHKAFSKDAIGEGGSGNIEDADAYRDGAFEGFSILVCMFYSNSDRSSVDANISEDVFRNGLKGGASPFKSMQRKGFSVTIVKTYSSAIKELDKGSHCVCMVLSSAGFQDSVSDGKYAQEFIRCLNLYWQQGGCLFLFGENDPFFFEVNMFLAQAKFETERGIRSCGFKLYGNWEGAKRSKTWIEDKGASSSMLSRGTFCAQTSIRVGRRQIPAVRGGLRRIFEGNTIAMFSEHSEEKMYPFVPFA